MGEEWLFPSLLCLNPSKWDKKCSGHCWRRRNEVISEVLLRARKHRHISVGKLANTYIHHVCIDTWSRVEDLLDRWEIYTEDTLVNARARARERERERERERKRVYYVQDWGKMGFEDERKKERVFIMYSTNGR